MSMIPPMRKPSRMPFFTQALTRQPVGDRKSTRLNSSHAYTPPFRSVLVEEGLTRGVNRHVDDTAHAETEQNALLHPGIDAPAGGRVAVRRRRARASFIQCGFKFGEEAEMGVGVSGGLLVVEPFDFSLQPARSLAGPGSPALFRSGPNWPRRAHT